MRWSVQTLDRDRHLVTLGAGALELACEVLDGAGVAPSFAVWRVGRVVVGIARAGRA